MVGFIVVIYLILVVISVIHNAGVKKLLANANEVQYHTNQSHLNFKRDFVRVEKIINPE